MNPYIKYSTMAFQMVVIIGAGVYLGRYLDEKYPRDFQVFTVLCSLLAVFLSIFQVIREVIKISKKQ
jgi:hypothetical protein